MDRNRKRNKPTQEDKKRIAEAISNLDTQRKIVDNRSFHRAYKDYFENHPYWIESQRLEDDIFSEIQEYYPEMLEQEKEFKKAGGKSLKQDKQKTSKVVVTDKKKYRKLTSQRADLKGLDTKFKPFKPSKYDFKFSGTQKKRIVYARKITIMRKGKQQKMYIDRKGKYVKIRK
jgi:hypothetical protein